MRNRKLVVGLAATFIGLTVVLAVAGLVVHPILVFVAVPFGLAAYLLWLHASGRLADRVRTRRTSSGRTRGRRSAGDGRAREYERTRASARRNREAAFDGARGTAGGRGGTRSGGAGTHAGARTDRASAAADPAPTRREAAETLGVDPEADQETVRAAYRERAKTLHPDADGGDEAAFKELTRAYDRLRE
ncbi:J domain-containing protein [Halopenitus salinus]|uniref:J domain-containing protein n=1 Tax=Halopenitus salinus TaxID=1198295 RepID=A0ABD5URK4_9EURY